MTPGKCFGSGAPTRAELPRRRRGLFLPWSLVTTATTYGMARDRIVAAQERAYQGLQRLYEHGAQPSYVGSERRDGGDE